MTDEVEISWSCLLYTLGIIFTLIIVGSILGAVLYPLLYGILGLGLIILFCLICMLSKGDLKVKSKTSSGKSMRITEYKKSDVKKEKIRLNRLLTEFYVKEKKEMDTLKEVKILEKDIENYIKFHPEILEEGLVLIGNQYKTEAGYIDILFKDKDKNYLVVELKKDKGTDKVVGQIQRYMVWVEENLARGNPIRGMIVVKKPDKRLNYAIKGTKYRIEIKTFGKMPPVKRNVKYCDECGALNRKSAKVCTKCGTKFWM